MDIALALIILVGLAAAFLLARRSAKMRRKKLLEGRERTRRKQQNLTPRKMSHRTEMRAYDDPSTLADEITTRGSQPTTTQNPSGSVVTNTRVSDRAGARAKPEIKPDGLRATGKQSREDGK